MKMFLAAIVIIYSSYSQSRLAVGKIFSYFDVSYVFSSITYLSRLTSKQLHAQLSNNIVLNGYHFEEKHYRC